MGRIRTILIALPVLNEERVLRASLSAVSDFIRSRLPGREVLIVIADNGSTDGTATIAEEIAAGSDDVRHLRIPARGKGLAVRTAWNTFDADAYAFMDIDLSTGLDAFLPALEALEAGADIAAGSRFHRTSRVSRSALRRLVSHGYRLWLRILFGTVFSDGPCGFKVVSPRVVRELLPLVKDEGWFFDSELMIRSEKAGAAIVEVPVDWREARDEGRDSKVDVGRLALEYARKTLRLRKEFL